jgi:Cu/Ag efflux protein CusF
MTSQYYKVTARVGVPHRNAVEVTVPLVGPAGPQGVPGTGLEVLTTQGDLLYQGAATGERLPIGTNGQVLKVSGGIPAWGAESGAVTSVAGKTGVVTLDKNDVGLGNVANTAQVTSVTGTAPIASSGGTTPAISITAATTSAAGSMSSADKTKLDGVASGATANTASTATPSALGTAAAGSSTDFARADHVHAMPEIADLGDVVISNLADNALLQYDAATQTWSNNDLGTIFQETENAASDLGLAAVASSGSYDDLDNKPTLGTSATADIGTGAGEVAEGDHTHGNLTNDGKVGSTAGLPLVTTTAGAVTTLALGTAGQVLQVNSGANGVEFAAAAGGDTVSIEASAADVLSVSSGAISAVDATADKIVFYDDSASELTYLELGSGLSITDQTISATASGGSKTYAVFTATDNQPPATAYATLDTRNSIAVLDFDDATDESAVFVSIIPEAASLGSGLKIRLHWMASTATSGDVVWDVSLERMTTDLDTDSFDTIASGTAAANGTSGILTVTEITLTTIDSVTAGDGFRLKVTRDANNASDTMTGDAELVVCEVRSAA